MRGKKWNLSFEFSNNSRCLSPTQVPSTKPIQTEFDTRPWYVCMHLSAWLQTVHFLILSTYTLHSILMIQARNINTLKHFSCWPRFTVITDTLWWNGSIIDIPLTRQEVSPNNDISERNKTHLLISLDQSDSDMSKHRSIPHDWYISTITMYYYTNCYP
jgi:hypothetical protein